MWSTQRGTSKQVRGVYVRGGAKLKDLQNILFFVSFCPNDLVFWYFLFFWLMYQFRSPYFFVTS